MAVSTAITPIHQAACILLLDRAGRFILQHRDDKPGIWNPGLLSVWGGAVEDGENPLEAAVREMAEETSLQPTVVDLQFLGIFPRPFAIGGQQVVQYLYALVIDHADDLQVYEGQGHMAVEAWATSPHPIAGTTAEFMAFYRWQAGSPVN